VTSATVEHSQTVPPPSAPANRRVVPDPLRRLVSNPGAAIALVVLAFFVLIAVAAPVLARYDPLKQVPTASLSPPSLAHPFGTDRLGRDVLTRVMYGARLSLWAAFIATVIGAAAGVLPGLVAGFRGGWLDGIVMRSVDVLLAFPGIILALAIISVLGNGLPNVMVAVGIALVPSFVRLGRALTLSARTQVYVDAARCIGCGDLYIVLRHIMPNILPHILILATVTTAWAVIIATSLNFLGLGVQPPTPEWGFDLAQAREYLERAWWVVAFPGGAIAITLLSINLLGDGLRDALDPKFRTR
jgi:ABC-type dipeptide/oligopeptide/nickel transport system permease subunit